MTDAQLRPTTGPLTSSWSPAHPVDLRRTLGPLRRGSFDPTFRVDADGLWRTSLTPLGPATLHLLTGDSPSSGVTATAWGPGAEWMLAQVPEMLGAGDDWSGLDCAAQPLLARTMRAVPGLRIPRTGLVFESLVPAVLEQRVVSADARRSWFQLVSKFGEVPPGPAPVGMRVSPSAVEWGRIPSWEWHLAGVDPGRAATVAAAARVAAGLQRTVNRGRGGPAVTSALRTVRGIGVWTAAEIVQRAHGDPDTVSVGDFHLPALVGWAMIGKPVDDDGMLELLAPWHGHRHRVMRLIESSGFTKPRFGPRASRVNHRGH
ncbi:MAG: DNA-3-methyladenine glycosylase 2 family protein [Nakamurella sp.]